MTAERGWQSAFVLGLAVGLPIGAFVSIIGLILGLVSHIWVILWMGLGIVLVSILFVSYAVLTPLLRLSSGMRQLNKQMTGNVIGQGIAWENVDNVIFRVVEFIANATVDGEKVRANSKTSPYAMLKVESPLHNEPLVMPVLHRLDFLHLWKCFNEKAVGGEKELMVCYLPSRQGKVMPHLALMIGPKGSIESVASGVPSRDVFSLTRIYWDPGKVLDRKR